MTVEIVKSVDTAIHQISELRRWDTEQVLTDPWFQRNLVWPTKYRSSLIETIMLNFPIPEIFIRITENGTAEILDGKQRIYSILAFLDNTITWYDPEKRDSFTFRALEPRKQHFFLNYPLVFRELKGFTESEARDIFERLNIHVLPLNRQEMRHAGYRGEFASTIDMLAKDNFFRVQSIMSLSKEKRMHIQWFVADLVLGMMDGPNESSRMDSYYEKYDQSFPQKATIIKDFLQVKTSIEDIFGSLIGTRLNRKADLYGLWLALYQIEKEYDIPLSNYPRIADSLKAFRHRVDIQPERLRDSDLEDYFEAVYSHSTHANLRIKLVKCIKKVIIPYCKKRVSPIPKELQDHISKIKCLECGETFETIEEMSEHKRTVHVSE